MAGLSKTSQAHQSQAVEAVLTIPWLTSPGLATHWGASLKMLFSPLSQLVPLFHCQTLQDWKVIDNFCWGSWNPFFHGWNP